MWVSALPVLWALSAAAVDFNEGHSTAGATTKLWSLGLHENVHNAKEDKRGECVEEEPCPISCMEGMPCLHMDCSHNSECDGALKCCKTLCGTKCMFAQFKLPCTSDQNCPETTSCCYDGTCDSHCPARPEKKGRNNTDPSVEASSKAPLDEQYSNNPHPTVYKSSNSVNPTRPNLNEPDSTVKETNQAHPPMEEANDGQTNIEDRNPPTTEKESRQPVGEDAINKELAMLNHTNQRTTTEGGPDAKYRVMDSSEPPPTADVVIMPNQTVEKRYDSQGKELNGNGLNSSDEGGNIVRK
ncbi:uncharacterized protein [Ambystoma mexicanum]|uniref:uncharacterized protein isoform X2 n=1 Tax=Ambystoma mexicanum TaxID=8296 RepID=UPI0037E9B438